MSERLVQIFKMISRSQQVLPFQLPGGWIGAFVMIALIEICVPGGTVLLVMLLKRGFGSKQRKPHVKEEHLDRQEHHPQAGNLEGSSVSLRNRLTSPPIESVLEV